MTILKIDLEQYSAEDATAILAAVARRYKSENNAEEGEIQYLPWPAEGLAIFRVHNGTRYDAIAHEDGRIEFDGKTYPGTDAGYKAARQAVGKAAGLSYTPSLPWWFQVIDPISKRKLEVAKVYDCKN